MNKNNEQKTKTIMYCRYTEVHNGNSDNNPLLPSPDGDFGDAVWDYTDVDVKIMYNNYLDKLRAEGERRFGGTWK